METPWRIRTGGNERGAPRRWGCVGKLAAELRYSRGCQVNDHQRPRDRSQTPLLSLIQRLELHHQSTDFALGVDLFYANLHRIPVIEQ